MRKRVTEFMTWREDNGVTSITAVQPLHGFRLIHIT
jgi:hypothetical protein